MSGSRPSACFVGARVEALEALRRYADVQTIVAVPHSRVHQYCEELGLDCHLVTRDNKQEIFQFLAQQIAGLVLSAGFPFVLPGRVLASGATFVNSHPSLLPAYKGYNAIKTAFANREDFMGVTVHFMVEEVDAGPLIHQEKVRVGGLQLQEIYDLLFGVVEPMAITKSIEKLAQGAARRNPFKTEAGA